MVIEGDTIDVQGERIRILTLDAPESFSSRCKAELKLALPTKERLAQLLRSGPVEISWQGSATSLLPYSAQSRNLSPFLAFL